MSGEIIRLGDPTSHGGVVIEGSVSDICMGKPIAYVGHMTACPKCKGSFPIAEGALTTTFYGKGVALAGMKTACGASLVATQFTDCVEYGSGHQGTTSNSSTTGAAGTCSGLASFAQVVPTEMFDLYFLVKNSESEIVSNTPYRITLSDGRIFEGVTDQLGHTQKVSAPTALQATIEVPYYDDSNAHAANQSEPCGC